MPTALSNYRVGELGTTYDVIAGDLSGDGAAERVYPFGVDGDAGGEVDYYRWTTGGYKFTKLPNADGLSGSIADINGDGYGDLVLGDSSDPNSDKPGGHKGGQITVWYGGPNGPDPAQTPTVIHQDSANVPGSGETDDAFGSFLSTGDINGDKFADVAVAAPGEDIGTAKEVGSVTVLFGSASGLKTSGSKSYTQNTAGVPGTAESWDRFGSAVDLTDITKDGKADLTVGVDGENGSGGVWTLRGSSTGLTTSGAQGLTAAAVSLKSTYYFGSVIAQ